MLMPQNFKLIIFFLFLLFIALLIYFSTNKIHKVADELLMPDLRIYDSKSLIKTLNSSDNKYTKNLFDDPINAVYKYVSLPINSDFGSHVIPLTVAALISSNDLLEIGMGIYSTSLLHRISTDLKRKLVSIENDFEWLSKFIIFNQTKYHKIYHISSDELITYGSNKPWGLILIDHIVPKKRFVNAIKYSKIGKVLVLHDAEKTTEINYRYVKYNVLYYFKYACKFSLYQSKDGINGHYVSTLILSNYINLDKLKDLFSKIPSEFGHLACNLDM